MMKILLFSRYGPLGASSRVRSYQYLPYLKAHGIDVTVLPFLEDDYLRQFYSGRVNHLSTRIGSCFRRLIGLIKCKRFDLIWIEKELFPWLPSLCESLIAHLGIPYVVDYDDATFHRYDTHPNMFVRRFLKNKIDIIMRHATVVVVGNHYLAQRAYKAGAKCVEHLPTVVDLKRYPTEEHAKNGVFTIGWIGTPVTVRCLETIRPALSEWCRKNMSQLVVVGANSFELIGSSVAVHPWSQDSEVSEIQGFDIGIMPLSNDPWERGKCGYKLIQYMACGKPVIASPVGVNSKIVEHGVNGFLVRSKKEWIEALDFLYANPDQRYKMGKAGRKKVETEYCLQVTAPKLLAILNNAAKNK